MEEKGKKVRNEGSKDGEKRGEEDEVGKRRKVNERKINYDDYLSR